MRARRSEGVPCRVSRNFAGGGQAVNEGRENRARARCAPARAASGSLIRILVSEEENDAQQDCGSASLRAPGMAAEEEWPAIRAARAFDAGSVEDARRAIEAGGEEDARTLANVAVLDYVSKIPREAGDEASLLERLRGAEGALARETSTSSESLELASHDSYALRVNTAFALQMLGRDEESANILEGLFADAVAGQRRRVAASRHVHPRAETDGQDRPRRRGARSNRASLRRRG